jgi:ribosomal protein S27E
MTKREPSYPAIEAPAPAALDGGIAPPSSLSLPADALVAPATTTQVASIIEKPRTGNRSNRSKYSCPACALNVWGKPGLKVGCVDCGVVLQESDE